MRLHISPSRLPAAVALLVTLGGAVAGLGLAAPLTWRSWIQSAISSSSSAAGTSTADVRTTFGCFHDVEPARGGGHTPAAAQPVNAGQIVPPEGARREIIV